MRNWLANRPAGAIAALIISGYWNIRIIVDYANGKPFDGWGAVIFGALFLLALGWFLSGATSRRRMSKKNQAAESDRG